MYKCKTCRCHYNECLNTSSKLTNLNAANAKQFECWLTAHRQTKGKINCWHETIDDSKLPSNWAQICKAHTVTLMLVKSLQCLTLSSQWCQMVTLHSVQRHTGITYPFKNFDIRALWHSVLRTRVPECRKIKNGGLDQYGAERFRRLHFCHNQKKCGTERVNSVHV